MQEYISFIQDHISDNGASEEDLEELARKMRRLCRMELQPYTSVSKMFHVLDYVYDCMKYVITDPDIMRSLCETYFGVYQDTTEYIQKKADADKSDVLLLNYISTTFTRDMLDYEIGDDRAYFTIMDKLERLYFKTAYLCLFENEVVYRQNENFKMPENILLKAYMHDGEAVCQEAGRQKFPMKNLVTHFFEGQEHRSTVIVTLLFSTLEQYGLLISEIEEAYMHYTTPISYQISSAVKTLELLKNKEDITAQLEKSLVQIKESNAILDEMSKSDELTQIYNRRGFLTTVQHQVMHPANLDKQAIIIYADMNNLKVTSSVKEFDIIGIEKGEDVIIRSSALGNEEFDGVVTKVSPVTEKSADGSTVENGSYGIEVAVSDEDTGLLIGMSAKLSIITEEKSDIFSVRYDMLSIDEEGNDVIYAAEKNGDSYVVKQIPVTLGIETDSEVEISGEGLEEGMYIIEDVDYVSDGMTVMLRNGSTESEVSSETEASSESEG